MPWSAVLRQLLELGLRLRDTGDVLRRRVLAGTAVKGQNEHKRGK